MKVSLNLVPPLVSVHPPPSLTLAPLPQRGTELEEGVLEQPLAWMSMHVVQPWHTCQSSRPCFFGPSLMVALPHPHVHVFLCVVLCEGVKVGYFKQLL